MKHSFKNDYSESAHPKILEALSSGLWQQQPGYGGDAFTSKTQEMFQQMMGAPSSKVYLVSGGTQANLVVISALLRPYESVIAAEIGHILNNETGAIEATGHKIHSVASSDGKLKASDIENILATHQNVPHQVVPKLVYISNATEVGTIYKKSELTELSEFCKSHGLYLFMDGARLSQALASEPNDLTLKDIAKLTDVFYFGGTKNGILFGEAIILNNTELQSDFGFHLKQKGALLAKGSVLGLQFQALLTDDLYLHLARHANQQAMKIKSALCEKGFEMLSDTHTNQIFPILKNSQIEVLSEKFDFYIWKSVDEEHSAIRLMTSWATSEAVVEDLIKEIQKL